MLGKLLLIARGNDLPKERKQMVMILTWKQVLYAVLIHLSEYHGLQIKLSRKNRNRIYTLRTICFYCFVFTHVDIFAHLNTLISKIITVKYFFLDFMVHCHIWRRKQICLRLVAKVEACCIQETEYITK